MGKCFCHFNGYEVKDALARRDINSLKNNVDKLNTLFSNLSLTSEVVNSTLEMTDIEKIYINKSDNNWYYYDEDTSSFVVGGQFLYNLESGITYDKLDIQLKRGVFPHRNIEWKYDDATNITRLYSDLFYYGGYFINNSELELNLKLKKVDHTASIIEEKTIKLNKGETYVIENYDSYHIEITKVSNEPFELLETILLSSNFNFISNIFREQKEQKETEVIYENADTSLLTETYDFGTQFDLTKYEYLEVFYFNSDYDMYGSTKIQLNLNNKFNRFKCDFVKINGGTLVYVSSQKSLNTETKSILSHTYKYTVTEFEGEDNTSEQDTKTYITKIVGYLK